MKSRVKKKIVLNFLKDDVRFEKVFGVGAFMFIYFLLFFCHNKRARIVSNQLVAQKVDM